MWSDCPGTLVLTRLSDKGVGPEVWLWLDLRTLRLAGRLSALSSQETWENECKAFGAPFDFYRF